MSSPALSPQTRLARLDLPGGRLRMVLDTDTYNEIDDQFALVYALLSPERLDVEAIYAAPFHNARSSGPADGMEKSYEEILRLLSRLDRSPDGFVFKGATAFLGETQKPVESPAARDLIERALAAPEDDPLYVVAIGAITNVASALLMEPRIVEKIVVVWLGGHAFFWPDSREFNLRQDVPAARTVFDSGVPLVHVPCLGVTSHLSVSPAEIEKYVRGRGAIGDYLADIFAEFVGTTPGRSKVMWDMAAVAYLLNSAWTPADLVHSPIVTEQATWSFDSTRHLIRSVRYVARDPIVQDFFTKLERSR